MGLLGNLFSAGASIFGSGISAYGQHRANQQSSQEAEKNRDFQADQYANRYQIQRGDLEAAGYNPALGMGAMAPGPSPQGGQASTFGNVGHSAESAARSYYEIQNMKQQVEQSKTQSNLNAQAAKKEAAQALYYNNSASNVISQTKLLDLQRPEHEANSKYYEDSSGSGFVLKGLEKLRKFITGR